MRRLWKYLNTELDYNSAWLFIGVVTIYGLSLWVIISGIFTVMIEAGVDVQNVMYLFVGLQGFGFVMTWRKRDQITQAAEFRQRELDRIRRRQDMDFKYLQREINRLKGWEV